MKAYRQIDGQYVETESRVPDAVECDCCGQIDTNPSWNVNTDEGHFDALCDQCFKMFYHNNAIVR